MNETLLFNEKIKLPLRVPGGVVGEGRGYLFSFPYASLRGLSIAAHPRSLAPKTETQPIYLCMHIFINTKNNSQDES